MGGLALMAGITSALAAGADAVSFNRDVLPVLSDNCLACHGADPGSRKGGLRLDREEHAFLPAKSGDAAIVRGKPAQSPLIQRIRSTSDDDRMPPPKAHKRLTPAQVEMLERWITEGARYEEHWALVAPRRPAVPEIGVPHPVDAFLRVRQQAAGLEPNPPADRRTLIRRVSLDLTGLPPTPAEVEAFVKDPSPQAWETVVDRLLASPHYGEERARRWLDVARYADTQGLHHDDYREIWPYRDWVIRAFNDNVPFDRFTVEQLAGDLLPNPTLEQLVATGYLRCNVSTAEGGVIADEVAANVAKDRIEAFGAAWLGLTIGCAQCHDHKFDPLTTRDYYQLAAVFRNGLDRPVEPAHRDNVDPIIPVPAVADRPVLGRLEAEMASLESATSARITNLAGSPLLRSAATTNAVRALVERPVPVLVQPLTAAALAGQRVRGTPGTNTSAFVSTGGATVEFTNDVGRIRADRPFAVSVEVKLEPGAGGALVSRLNRDQDFRGWDVFLEKGALASHVISKWPGNALKVTAKSALPTNRWVRVTVAYDGSRQAKGLRLLVDGAVVDAKVDLDALKGDIRATNALLRLGARTDGDALPRFAARDLRLYEGTNATDYAAGVIAQRLLEKSGDKARHQQLAELVLRETDEQFGADRRRLGEVTRERDALLARTPRTRIMREKTNAPVAYILKRGQYDLPGELVGGDVPHIFARLPAGVPTNRLGLARWLTMPGHPLTARVTVNRYWQDLFGAGLVASAGDFGIMGDKPSHPELLDWLAVEFQERGWDTKRLLRLLVTSETYRQSARATAAQREKDPRNLLLARGPRHRLDAEVIRDLALSASGLLVPDVGGAPARPYQPPNVWEAVAMKDSNTREYRQDKGRNLYRRSLYTFIKRSALHPAMDAFNAPSREVCLVRRERANTPLQALVLLNDPQFFEAARRLAENALEASGDVNGRLDYLSLRLLARPLSAAERAATVDVHRDLLAHYRAQPGEAARAIAHGDSKPSAGLDPVELAAWTLTASQLMSLDATLNK